MTMMRYAPLLLLMVLGIFPLAAQEREDVFDLTPYEGKYNDHPTLKAFDSQLAQACETAYKKACDSLGVDPEAYQKSLFRIFIDDGSSWAEGKFVQARMNGQETSGYGARGQVQIRILSEYLVSGWSDDPHKTLHHEFIHAIQRYQMDQPVYRAIPVWIQEGVASWCAGQATAKTSYYLTSPQLIDNPLQIINGLEDSPRARHTGYDYVEDAWAIEWMTLKAGDDFVPRLHSALVKGTNWKEALEDILGLPWKQIRAKCRLHAEKRVEEHITKDRAAYGSVVRIRDSKNWDELLNATAHFKVDHPESSYRRFMDYFAAQAHFINKDTEKCLRGIDAFLTSEGPKTQLEDDALMMKGMILSHAGRHAEAARTFMRLVRDYPAQQMMPLASYYLGYECYQAGMKDRALKALRMAVSGFPQFNQMGMSSEGARNMIAELSSD